MLMETINSIKVRTVRAKELKDKMNENNTVTYDVDNKRNDDVRFSRCSVINDSIYLRFATDKTKGGINAKDGVICREYINVDFGGNKKLREELYKNGFTIEYIKQKKDGTVDTTKIHYEMLMRSPSHAKEGHCLFINAKKRKKHLNYLMMGLYDKVNNTNVDIVKLSAYMTLTTATSLGYLRIPWDSILVIKDIVEYCNKKAVIVKTNDENRLYCDWKDSWRLKNTLFDGQGLIDESIFPKETDNNGRPIYDGFVYCRNHFFKSCLFRGNIQDFYKDYYKDEYESAKVTDMFGVEHYVKDIKVIVSNESLKWLKFTDLISDDEREQQKFYDNILKEDDYMFQIIKTAHPSKYGKMVKTSCQMVSSLPCFGENVDESIEKLVEPTVNFLKELKSDTDKYVEYIENNSPDYKVDKALAAIYRKFPDFQYIDRFKERKKKALAKFREYTTQGKMLFEGNNLTMGKEW